MALILAAVVATAGYIGFSRLTRERFVGFTDLQPGEVLSIEYHVGGVFAEMFYEFRVVSGSPAIDVYLLTATDFGRFQAGVRPADAASIVLENVTLAVGDPFPPEGTYFGVVDNTDFGSATPGGSVAQVWYDLRAGGVVGTTFVEVVVMGLIAIAFLVGVERVTRGRRR